MVFFRRTYSGRGRVRRELGEQFVREAYERKRGEAAASYISAGI